MDYIPVGLSQPCELLPGLQQVLIKWIRLNYYSGTI